MKMFKKEFTLPRNQKILVSIALCGINNDPKDNDFAQVELIIEIPWVEEQMVPEELQLTPISLCGEKMSDNWGEKDWNTKTRYIAKFFEAATYAESIRATLKFLNEEIERVKERLKEREFLSRKMEGEIPSIQLYFKTEMEGWSEIDE